MRNRKTRRIICIRCGKIFDAKTSLAKRCHVCRKIRQQERANVWSRKNYKNNKQDYLAKQREYHCNREYKKKGKCVHCGKEKLIYARKLCEPCYKHWWWLNYRLKSMSDSEKIIYFKKHGLLKEEKKLTVEDLKKDLGVFEKQLN